MNNLFKPIEPYNSLFLNVSSKHIIYVEEAGNPGNIAAGVPSRTAKQSGFPGFNDTP